MAKTEKVSVSIDADDLKWIKKRARGRGGNVSAVVAEGTRLLRQREAQERLLARFGKDGEVSADEAEQIRREWLA